MARHTIQIPITKSSCSPTYYFYPGSGSYFHPEPVGNILYMQSYRSAGFNYYRNMGLGWVTPDYIKQKNIIDTVLSVYSLEDYEKPIGYRFTNFNEGSSLPAVIGYNSGTFEGLTYGWNHKSLGSGSEQEVIIGSLIYDDLSINVLSRVYSHRNSTNKPYISITYDDIPPEKPSSLYPNQTTQSTRDVIRFSWMHNSNEELMQKGFTIQYSLNNGGTWTTISGNSPNQFYDMPANTLPTSGTVLWKVRTRDGNDEVSEFETASFNLGILPQQPPIPIAPISQYIDRTKSIRFEWSFTGGNIGDTQSKFDLSYSVNGGSSWTTITETTTNTYYELEANTFSNGNVMWRVRTYSNWDEISPYSENKSFTVIGSPAIPLISNVTNTARPVVSWETNEQHVYELQILQGNDVLYDTGSIPSTSDRSLKIPTYLQDGNYRVKLRISNEYNFKSDWAEKSFNVSTIKPQQPELNLFSQEHSVTIKTSNTSEKTLIYRDNKLIGATNNNSFTDYTGENKKDYKYFVRTVDENDNFADSEIKAARCNFSGNTVALASKPESFLKLIYGLDSFPKKTHNINNQGSLVYYDGRTYPVEEYSNFSSKSKTLSMVLKNKKELDKLIKMVEAKGTLLYRDADGENIYGAVFNLDYEKNVLGYYQIGFTITQVDYKGAAYD